MQNYSPGADSEDLKKKGTTRNIHHFFRPREVNTFFMSILLFASSSSSMGGGSEYAPSSPLFTLGAYWPYLGGKNRTVEH